MVMRELAAGRKESCWAWWAWPTPPAARDEGQWSTRSQKWQLHQHEARAMLADTFLCDCVVEIFDLVKRQLHNGADTRALAGDDLPRLLASCRMWEWIVEHPGHDCAADRKLQKKWNQLLEACRGIRNRLKRRKRDTITTPHMPRAWELMAETMATRASPSKHLSQVGSQLLQQGNRLDGCVNYAQHTWASVIASLQTLGLHGDDAGPTAHWDPTRNAEINDAIDQESHLKPAHRYSNFVYYTEQRQRQQRVAMGDVVGAADMKIAPTAERVIPETYSLVNDTFNMAGSNLQFKAGVDTYAGVCAVLSEEAAIKGNLDLNHANCERVGPVHGVTGDSLHIVCRFNGLRIYIDKRELVLDVYIARNFNCASVDLLIGAQTLRHYGADISMGHGTCILPKQRLVLGRGHVSEVAALITSSQIDHLKGVQINDDGDTDLTARVHAAITQSNEHAECTQLAQRSADQYSAYCMHQHVIGALEHTLRSTHGDDQEKWPPATVASIQVASQRADTLWDSYIDTESHAYAKIFHQSDDHNSSPSTSCHELCGGGGGDSIGYASPIPNDKTIGQISGQAAVNRPRGPAVVGILKNADEEPERIPVLADELHVSQVPMKYHPAEAPEGMIPPRAQWAFNGEPVQRVLHEYFKEKAKWAKDGIDPERNQSSPVTAFNSWLRDWRQPASFDKRYPPGSKHYWWAHGMHAELKRITQEQWKEALMNSDHNPNTELRLRHQDYFSATGLSQRENGDYKRAHFGRLDSVPKCLCQHHPEKCTCGDPSTDLLRANAAVRLPAKRPMETAVPPRAEVDLDDDDDAASDIDDEPDEPSVETMSKEVQDIFQTKAGALSEANQEILSDYIVAWIDHSKATQSKAEWKTLWERSKKEECLLQPPDEVFEEAKLDSYEVYATADFQDEVKRFEEKDCVAERALLENDTDTGGRLRWNEAGECVCYVNMEIHKGWMAQSTPQTRRRQAKEAAFVAVVGSKRPNRLGTDVFAPKGGKPKVKADADILLEHDAEDHSLDVVRNAYFKFLNLDKAGTTFTNAYTSDDIDPSNAMRIPWVEHWRERLRKRTLRPIGQNALKIIIENLKAFSAAGWIERYVGPVPPLISPMVVVKKKPPLGEDGLPDLTAPQKYRLCIDAKESNAITIPPSAASDSIEDVVHGIKVMAKESLRQIKANEAGTRKLADTDIPIAGQHVNWLDSYGDRHLDAPPEAPVPKGNMKRVEGDELQFGEELEEPKRIWASQTDIVKAFHRLLTSRQESNPGSGVPDIAKTAFGGVGLPIFVWRTGAMGNSLTVQEWQRFLVRKLRKYHVLSEDIPGEEDVPLDPTPIDLGDGRGAVDSLAEIDGLPAPSRFIRTFCDDLTMVAASRSEALRQWKMLCMIAHREHLWLDGAKTILGSNFISVLGSVCNHRVVMADPGRVSDLNDIPPPTLERKWSRTAVKRFLGGTLYYAAFCTNMSRNARPLHRLTRNKDEDKIDIPANDISSHWTMPRHDNLKDTHWITLTGRAVKKLEGELSCQEGFEAIKSELMELALRYQPDPSKPYMCTTDASLYGIGMSIHVQCDETKAWLPVVIQSETLHDAATRWSASEREFYAVKRLFQRNRRILWGCQGTSVVVLTDHAANAGIEKKQTVNNSKISNWLLELQEFQPFSILYREGTSGVMGLADLCSRLLDVSKPALDQDPDWSFVNHLEKLPQWKWMFKKVDERMGAGDTVFGIGQPHEAQSEEEEAEARRADDRQALLEDMKTATMPSYDANELQAQFQAVAAVQQSMTTTQTFDEASDAANVALSLTDPQGRVLLLKDATNSAPGTQDSGWNLPASKRQYTKTSSEVALALFQRYGKAYGNDSERSLTKWKTAQSGILGDVDYYNIDVSLENLSGTSPHSEFRLHMTDSQGDPRIHICAWFSLDNLPKSMPADEVGALQEHPRWQKWPVKPVAHVVKGTKDAKGSLNDDGLFITAENDTPQRIEKLLVRLGIWKKGDNMAKQLIDWNQTRPDILLWRQANANKEVPPRMTQTQRFSQGMRLRGDGPWKGSDIGPSKERQEEMAEEVAKRISNGRHAGVIPDIQDGHPARFAADHATPKQYQGSQYAEMYEYCGKKRCDPESGEEGFPAFEKKGGAPRHHGFYFRHGDLLYRTCTRTGRAQLVVPDSDHQQELIRRAHIGDHESHCGAGKTLWTLQQYVYWKDMARDVGKYCIQCLHCQRNNHRRCPEPGYQQRWEEPQEPGYVHVDMLTGLPPDRFSQNDDGYGYNAVLVMTDRWSGYTVAVPTTTTLDSSGYAHLIYDEWVVRHHRGVPRMFITDRAPIATAEFNDCWCTLMGIKQAMTTVARSSRANAMAEITIQMLTSAIRHCDLTQQSWVKRILPACAVLNSTLRHATKMSPIEMETGRRPRTALGMASEFDAVTPVEKDVKQQLLDIQHVQQSCHEAVLRAREAVAKLKDGRKNNPHWLRNLRPGHLVFVEAISIVTPARRAGILTDKTSPKYYGPYAVKNMLGYNTVELKKGGKNGLPATSKVWPQFHFSRLRPFYDKTSDISAADRKQWTVATTDLVDLPEHLEPEEYVVESIQAERLRYGKNEYLVKWKGYAVHEMTWEPEKNCENAKSAIKKFQERRDALKGYDQSQQMDFEHLMAVEKENNCAARILNVHDRGQRRRHIEERKQLQRWKEGDHRTTYIAMAETQPLRPPRDRTSVDNVRRAFGCLPLRSIDANRNNAGFNRPTVCVIAG